MNKKQRYTSLLLTIVGILVMVVLGSILFSTQRFGLVAREQQQLFVYQSEFLSDTLLQMGGLASLIGQWLVQFFSEPLPAVVITTLLLGLVTLMTWLTLRRISNQWLLFPLSFAPALWLMTSLLSEGYSVQGVVAYLLVLIALWAYSFAGKLKPLWRLSVGTVLTLLVYVLAGPVVSLFVVSAVVFDFCAHRRQSAWSLALIGVAVVAAYVSIRWAAFPTWKHALSPLTYYYSQSQVVLWQHLMSWLLLPVILLLAGLVRQIKVEKLAFKIIVCVVLAALMVVPVKVVYGHLVSEPVSRIQQLDYLARHHDWDGIIRLCQQGMKSVNELNLLNLALGEKGVLCERMFDFMQNGPGGLLFDQPKESLGEMRFDAYTYYSIGDLANTQNKAFDALPGLQGRNPTMLKLVTQCDLARGSYKVAERYLNLLKLSRNYKDWAERQARFLYNDKLLMQDSVLGRMRRDIPKRDHFVAFTAAGDNLLAMLETNPRDGKLLQYTLAYMMLCKDIDQVQRLVDRYYGTEALPKLPQAVQEALLFYSDYFHSMTEDYAASIGITKADYEKRLKVDENYCKQHGVTAYTLMRFGQFRDAYGLFKQGQQSNLETFRNTFWYYMLFYTPQKPTV